MSGCTHDCNQGRNCTCQITVAQPSRQTLQAEGKHPAPCTRFCEARAFEIEIRQLKAQIRALKADAERYRWLKDNCSYAYAMQPDSPAERGIEYQWQQGSYEERDWDIDSAIDDEISRAAIDAMKGET